MSRYAVRAPIAVSALALAAIAVRGCSGETATGPGECATSADCVSGWTCRDGRCAKLCNTDGECPLGTQVCRDGVCVDAVASACTGDGDCTAPGPCELGTGARCVGGGCQYPEPVPAGTPCPLPDPCAQSAACDGAGSCRATPRVCDDPPANFCNVENTSYRAYGSTGTCDPATGACAYGYVDIPCSDCAETCLTQCASVDCSGTFGGCRSNGTCVPGVPATCAYDLADDGAGCDRPGSPAGSLDGVCLAGDCVECRVALTDCVHPPGSHAECFTSACAGNVCTYTAQPAVSCSAVVCADGFTANARVCGTDGSCPDAGGISCNGLRCNAAGTECLTSCSGSGDCLDGLICDGGSCIGLLPDGAFCAGKDDEDCASGHCVDDVCCRTACDGLCEACGAGDGLCDEVPATDAACGNGTACDLSTCQSLGVCRPDPSGQVSGCNSDCHYCSGGACTYLTSGSGYGCTGNCAVCNASGNCVAPATDAACGNGTACDPSTCQALGVCTPNPTGQVSGCNSDCHYCSGGACTYLTSGSGYGCTGTCAVCNATGSCVAPATDANCGTGSACNPATCQSLGVCTPDPTGQVSGCNSDCHYCSGGSCEYLSSGTGYGCTGTCAACNVSGSCVAPATDAACGDGTPCDPNTCQSRGVCTPNPGTSTSCDDTDLCTYGDHCDGSGGCTGTDITCTSTPCGSNGLCDPLFPITRKCNGTSTCDATAGSRCTCPMGYCCEPGTCAPGPASCP